MVGGMPTGVRVLGNKKQTPGKPTINKDTGPQACVVEISSPIRRARPVLCVLHFNAGRTLSPSSSVTPDPVHGCVFPLDGISGFQALAFSLSLLTYDRLE